MDFPILVASLVLVITPFLINLLRSKCMRKKKLPPVAGTVFHQLRNFNRLHDYHTELCRNYTTFRLLSPFHTQIYTVDPVNVEYILKTNFNNYGKGSFNYINMKELFGDGIFAVDGEKWRHQRKLASHEFSTRNLRDFSSNIFKINAKKLASVISNHANSSDSMDIQDLFMQSTMDSIFKVGFGVELNSLAGSEEGSKFMEAFDSASVLVTRRYFDVCWKVKRFLGIGYEGLFPKHVKVIDDFVYKVIEKKMRDLSGEMNNSDKKEDLLSRFLSEMEKDTENMTSKYLRDIILNFMIAGKDTTAGTLSWFIYMLCKNPVEQEKVAQEVKDMTEDIDNEMNIEIFAGVLNDEALDKMQYLQAALTETLRLYPSVPLEPKFCFSDDTLPDGFETSKGDVVYYQPYAMGRMTYLWGEDAEIFRPERWINADGVFQPESPFKFTAFQAGPRICIGKEFAYRQMKIFAAVLLRFFKFKLRSENEEIKFKTMLTLHIDKGLHVHALVR